MTALLLRLTTLVAGLVLLGAALLGAGSTATASAAAPVVAAASAASASAAALDPAPAAALATDDAAAAAPAPGALDVSCATCEVPAPVLLLVLLAVVGVLAVGVHRLVLRAMRPRAPVIAPRAHPVDRILLAARRRAAAPALFSLSVLRV